MNSLDVSRVLDKMWDTVAVLVGFPYLIVIFFNVARNSSSGLGAGEGYIRND